MGTTASRKQKIEWIREHLDKYDSEEKLLIAFALTNNSSVATGKEILSLIASQDKATWGN